MKLIHRAAIIALTLAVTACAQLNEGLKNVNEGLGKVVGNNETEGQSSTASATGATKHESELNYLGGGTRTISFVIPARICYPDEYIHAYDGEYVSTWNQKLDAKTMRYRLSVTPADKQKYAEMNAKTLVRPKERPMVTPAEQKERRQKGCETTFGGTAEAITQANNEFLAEYEQ